MMKIGITGGMGSGKSIVSTLLNTFGIPVYIADDEAKRITASSPTIRKKLTQYFGTSLYNEKGDIDKKIFAFLIFGNEKNLETANAIIHPEVLKHFLLWTGQQNKNIVAIESAILFESGFQIYTDRILTVTAPLETRIQRVIRRSGITRNEVLKRISNQLSDEWKIKQSDGVIYNDNIRPIIPQMELILNQWMEFV